VLGGLKKPLRQPELLDLLKRVWTPKGGDEHHAELFSEVEVREALDKGEKPPMELAGQVIYYAGPSPTRPGRRTACPRGAGSTTQRGRAAIAR